jgi:hypothetical protein
MTPRASLRVLAVGLATLLWLTSGAPVWAVDWNDVPFPSEYVEPVDGTDTHFLAHEFDPDERQVVVDAQGDHWAVTTGSVHRLPNGGGAWIEETAGLDFLDTPYALGGSTLYYDQDVQKLFLFASQGAFVRGMDDTAWRPVNGASPGLGQAGYSVVKFGGFLWSITFDGLIQVDPQTETLLAPNERGLPSIDFDTQEQLSNVVATNDALYVGVHYLWEGGVQPSDLGQAGVFRLNDPDGEWVDAGLEVTALESELRPWSQGRPEWGVGALHATQGFVFASVYGSDFQANRLFVLDEAAGGWSPVPLPPVEPVVDDETGNSHYNEYVLSPWDVLPVWDARLYSNPQASYPNASDIGVQATFAVFDPRGGAWEADITRDAVAWTAAIPGDMFFLGDQIVVDRYHEDYYSIPETIPAPGFVASVPLPTQVSTDPEVIGTNAVMALFFALVFGAISTVFNSTLKENYERVSGWFAPLTRLAGRAKAALLRQPDGGATKPSRLTEIAARLPLKWLWEPLAIVVLSALVYGFLDPSFGATLDGLGLMLSLAIAIGVTTFAYEGLQSWLSSRRFGAPARMRLFPAAIAIAVACVAISRLMAFQPGYVFGIVGGLAFATTVQPDSKTYGRMVLISAGLLLALSLVAWFAAVPVAAAVESSGGFWLTTVQAALISMFVMGLEALLFGLLPLGFMDGEKVMRWSKVAWVAAFGTVAFAFWHVLLNPGSKYLDSLGQKNVVMMFALLGIYGLVTVVMFLYFRAPSRHGAPLVRPG